MARDVDAWDRAHLWRFRARAFRFVDGDTFVALADTGFDGAALPHIRIEDLHAPELHHEGGALAAMALQRALNTNALSGWNLRIESRIRETVMTQTKTFARYVARVWVVQADGRMVDVRELLA